MGRKADLCLIVSAGGFPGQSWGELAGFGTAAFLNPTELRSRQDRMQ